MSKIDTLEFMQMSLGILPSDIIEFYNLMEEKIISDDHVYILVLFQMLVRSYNANMKLYTLVMCYHKNMWLKNREDNLQQQKSREEGGECFQC